MELKELCEEEYVPVGIGLSSGMIGGRSGARNVRSDISIFVGIQLSSSGAEEGTEQETQ